MSTTAGVEVKVPDIGDFDDVPVIEILVTIGETVAAEDPLVTLESDKATMDVPSPVAGKVRELLVGTGDRVSQGSPIVLIEPASSVAGNETPAPAQAPALEPAAPPAPPEQPVAASPAAQPERPVTGSNEHGVYASPSVRRLARELGVDLGGVPGSGRKGRITPDDVRAADAGGSTGGAPPAQGISGLAGLAIAPWPVVDFERFGPVERVPLSRIQRISGPALARNWVMIPHVTQNDVADITELEAWRKQLNAEYGGDGVKVTMVSFLIAASVATLQQFPIFNASLDGAELVLRRYYNVGFAAETPGGLMVPVIHDADHKGLLEIARELATLSDKARSGKLAPGDMAGGTFTISSLGGIGGTSFTPIINAPEVAILGATRAAMKPVWDPETDSFQARLMLPLSLSYDHRVIDGAAAARFVVHLARVLSDLRRALL